MFKFERTMQQGKKPDMTPLIDIIFQLILFFMLTTTFVRVEAIDIFVSNSKPSIPQATSVAAPLVVSLKGTDIYLSGKKAPEDGLVGMIGRELAGDKGRQIKLVTEKGVNIQSLVTAIDTIKAAGGSNIILDALTESVATTNNPDEPPKPVPLPDLQSTKAMEGNAAKFDFDNPSGWMQNKEEQEE